MSRSRSRLADYAVYLGARLVICLLQSLSLETAQSLARLFGWLAYHLNRRHRQVALDNLRHAFPGRHTDAERDFLVRRVYAHFSMLVAEMSHLPRKLHAVSWRRYVHSVNGSVFVDVLTSGRPVLVVSGHFGNWELASYAMGAIGFDSFAIARTLDNPYLDAFVRRFRQKTGQTILAKNEDYDRIRDVLNQGGAIAMLADQDAGQRGQFVEFFGRPASTHKALALLALQYRAPILLVGSTRVAEPMRYRMECVELIYPEEYDDRPDAVKAITQRFSSALERLIRQAPEQYLWLHRRWKHQPLPKKRTRAA